MSLPAGAGAGAVTGCGSRAAVSAAVPSGKADHTLRIATGRVEPAPDTIVSTTTASPPPSPGLSLFHCHQQHHMDYGFMILLRCS
ncbi:hypothetical protein [Streptomyces sp. NPDC046759]|uniref:hypothetical protein n=1 Tax=Streptomyces sp. NPDC046759 TaxID=3155019 RepID=UPI0033EEDA51